MDEITLKHLKSLKLHETIEIETNLHVIRVPSGWIYVFYNESTNGNGRIATTTFVPQSNVEQYVPINQ